MFNKNGRIVAAFSTILITGCAEYVQTSGPAPSVSIYTDTDRDVALEAGFVWETIGIEASLADNNTKQQCPRHWYDFVDETDGWCEISVVIKQATAEELGPGVLGSAISDLRTVWVIDSAEGVVLRRIIAHEIGHIILGSIEHLNSGAGVMAISRPTDSLTQADRDLTCNTVNICR